MGIFSVHGLLFNLYSSLPFREKKIDSSNETIFKPILKCRKKQLGTLLASLIRTENKEAGIKTG